MPQTRAVQARILRVAILLVFGVIAGNLLVMQVVKHEQYESQSLENRQLRTRIQAPRGRILDRDGRLLADNVYIADITVPNRCLGQAGPDSTLEKLLTWLRLPRYETLDRLAGEQSAGRPRLTLVANAAMPQIAVIEERRRELPGVKVETRSRRRYLDGPLFGHVIGYVGETLPNEIGKGDDPDGYKPGDWIGRGGLEAVLEEHLRGQAGYTLQEVNAVGRVVGRREVELRPVRPGRDVVLTLSKALQDSLGAAMGDNIGCAVALSLPSGEVLAAVSIPCYDPNMFTSGISTKDWQALQSDPGHPFLNRLIQATYPPGSPYKIVTSLTALQLGIAAPGTAYAPCGGAYQLGNRSFRCWKRGGHGALDHTGALVHSCDVFYYQLGLRLSIDQLAVTARLLGLGATTGSPFKGESSGNVPDKAWYDRKFGARGWSRGVMLNNAIGQGELLVTPLQMAVLTGRVATGLADLRPTFVRDPAPASSPGLRALPIDAAHLDWVRRTMRQVVDAGTGTRARVQSIEVAGKTGTSENPHGEDHAWFVCFAPAILPEVAVVVILENGGHGGAVAAPVAGRWLSAYFTQQESPEVVAP
ncbi:MAG: penicillin-binding protein 2 [Candidatus Latescibacteria bacterium]|nr:penicillin-binding protein 2 [Candidatus Latescibacterota bacterium]